MSTRTTSLLLFAALTLACQRPSNPAGGGANEGFALPGSGEGSDEAAPVEPGPAPAIVRIEQRGVRIAPGRDPMQLSALVLDAEREILQVPVEWHSLDPEKIEVDALGRLSALGPLGPAFVTASAGDVIAEPLPVYVVDPSELPLPEDDTDAGTPPSVPPSDGSGNAPPERTDPSATGGQ